MAKIRRMYFSGRIYFGFFEKNMIEALISLFHNDAWKIGIIFVYFNYLTNHGVTLQFHQCDFSFSLEVYTRQQWVFTSCESKRKRSNAWLPSQLTLDIHSLKSYSSELLSLPTLYSPCRLILEANSKAWNMERKRIHIEAKTLGMPIKMVKQKELEY